MTLSAHIQLSCTSCWLMQQQNMLRDHYPTFYMTNPEGHDKLRSPGLAVFQHIVHLRRRLPGQGRVPDLVQLPGAFRCLGCPPSCLPVLHSIYECL